MTSLMRFRNVTACITQLPNSFTATEGGAHGPVLLQEKLRDTWWSGMQR